MMKSRTISVPIACDPPGAYAYLSSPENLPNWAPGFCTSVEQNDGEWLAMTVEGPIPVRFVGQNDFGVLDHYVRLRPDTELLNPMRVIPNGSGSELTFTLFQHPGMSDEQFDADAGLVEADLRRAKAVLEK